MDQDDRFTGPRRAMRDPVSIDDDILTDQVAQVRDGTGLAFTRCVRCRMTTPVSVAPQARRCCHLLRRRRAAIIWEHRRRRAWCLDMGADAAPGATVVRPSSCTAPTADRRGEPAGR